MEEIGQNQRNYNFDKNKLLRKIEELDQQMNFLKEINLQQKDQIKQKINENE